MHALARPGIALSIVVAALAGCAEPAVPSDAGPSPVAIAPPVPDETVFRETAVMLSPDGTYEVHEGTVTAGVERAENDRRDRGGITPDTDQDPNCATSSFWLYDQPNRTGNRICF